MCFGCFWFYSCERQKGDFSPVFCNWGFFFAVIIFLLVRRRRSGTALATSCWHVDMTWSCRIEATKPPRQLLLISVGPLSFQINFCCMLLPHFCLAPIAPIQVCGRRFLVVFFGLRLLPPTKCGTEFPWNPTRKYPWHDTARWIDNLDLELQQH